MTVTATPLNVSDPAAGSDVIFTDCKVFPASTSLKGKLPEANVNGVSSGVVTVLLAVVGASLTGVTLTVCVAVLLKTVPSLTWNPNVVYGEPLPLSAGANDKLTRLATGMT